MKYLCLIYDEEKKLESMPKTESDAFMGEYFAFTNGIKQSGHYLGGNALQPVSAATTVRMRNGKVSTTDGPFAETKEQLGGYYLIEAKDLDEATKIAARIPSALSGTIEVPAGPGVHALTHRSCRSHAPPRRRRYPPPSWIRVATPSSVSSSRSAVGSWRR